MPDVATAEARLRDETLAAVLDRPTRRLDAELHRQDPRRRAPPADRRRRTSRRHRRSRSASSSPPDPNRDISFVFANVGVILLFIAIFTFGTWVLTGVVEEKQSRVVEVVLSTIEARDLLIGKVLGIGLLGLLQLVVMVAVGLGAGVAGGRFSLPPTTASAVVMLFVWFILGYAFYSTALGVLGALASRMEEASNASSPITFVAMAAYFFSLLVALNDPAGVAARIATFVPPVAPMVVPLRAALGAIEPWEIVARAGRHVRCDLGPVRRRRPGLQRSGAPDRCPDEASGRLASLGPRLGRRRRRVGRVRAREPQGSRSKMPGVPPACQNTTGPLNRPSRTRAMRPARALAV